MSNDVSAKIYSDQRSLPIHLGDSGDGFTLPFKEKWRAPDAFAAVLGFIVTGALVTANINSGNALRLLIIGVVVTAAAVWLLSKLPATRPSLRTRARWRWENLRPQVVSSHRSHR
ncbi:hypothetical protein [Mycolicibacterium tusciae]|uniref:hypothetical protein n=1 Tax=Mycolicibacterium tusciae TaxID=75922 RepID=UPI00024A4314|nr:hypothetical protein [Mycolicibacterium tusciae]